jgi:hypothetical protein
MIVRRIAVLCLLVLMGLGAAQPAGPAQAGDPAVLTIRASGAPEIVLTLEDLKAIDATVLETATPWTEGKQEFVGVTGRALLAALRQRGMAGDPEKIIAVANNDYSIVLPVADFDQDELLIAYLRNGAALPVRDKGPLWIVFPFDSDAKYRTNTYKSYAIWGLVRLELQGG